jgi:integrase
MPKKNLTAKTLASLKPSEQRLDYFDTNLPGFCIRVTPNGVKTFSVLYRHAGRKRRYTIGTYPPLTLADARDKAKAALRSAEKGADPATAKRAEARADTFKELADLYMERYAKPKKKSWRDDDRRVNNVLVPKFGKIHAKAITRADVRLLLEEIAERAPIEANRTLALLRRIFSWALSLDLVEASPCMGIPRPAQEAERERTLTDDEIRDVWAACEAEGSQIATIFQLRLITGQRGRELARMRWTDIEDRWWTQPTGETKNRVAHRVWFSDLACKLLAAIPRESEWVFASPKKPSEPIVWTAKALARMRNAAGVKDFQARDLRRTVATRMAEAGVDPRTVDRILNHKERGIIRVYNRYEFDKEKQQAWALWSRNLGRILSNVKGLKARA